MVRRPAVQRHRQNARHGSLSDAPVPAENVSMGGAPLLNGVLERAGDVFLPDHLGEFLGTVLARQDLVAHGVDTRLYVMPPR